MTRTNQDIPRGDDDKYVAGDTATIIDTVVTDDGTPKSLSNVSITFQLSQPLETTPLLTKTDTDGTVEIVDAQDGVVAVNIDEADTEDLGGFGGEEYEYQIELTDSDGETATVTEGTWTIYPELG